MKQRKLKVLIIDDEKRRGASVEACLKKEGFETAVAASNHLGVLLQISELSPDIIVIDMESPGRDILESLSVLSSHQPTPVVMFSDEADLDYINKAVDAGVSAYIIGEFEESRVKPAIDVAMAQFRAFQTLRRELDDTRSELDDRRLIERAKLKIMSDHNLDEDSAHKTLREQAMKHRLKLGEVARLLLADDQQETGGKL